MTLAIELTSSEQNRLVTVAQMRGITPEVLARLFVIERLPEAQNGGGDETIPRTPEEIIRAMDAFAETNRRLPFLPDAAFDRESLYEDTI